jgi:hypothetical protein
MVIDVYNGKWGVPAKCGSRYFSKTVLLLNSHININYRVRFEDLNKLGLEAIIIRNPLSHLESALQTEIMECWDDLDNIKKILLKFSDMRFGGTHFHPQFCKKIYDVWYNGGLRIVDLSKLSEFMEKILKTIPYNPNEYDFHTESNYKSKKEVWDRCVELYPDLMNDIIEFVKIDTKYYHALLNGDRNMLKML